LVDLVEHAPAGKILRFNLVGTAITHARSGNTYRFREECIRRHKIAIRYISYFDADRAPRGQFVASLAPRSGAVEAGYGVIASAGDAA